ncbi:FAD/NAD(P)-binding domain-containing protein [Marasmius fiardii PR-910]|nr:FAD/NAD(P)-binding domain-containing protein [Marasmius fiardii PR-910]
MDSTLTTNRLPTLDKLNSTVPADLNVRSTAEEWFKAFSDCMSQSNRKGLLQLFTSDALWRDVLALTWDFRTFDGLERIIPFLIDQIPSVGFLEPKLSDLVVLQRPFPDLAWILAMFKFKTKTGLCTGVVRLVPTAEGAWKAHSIFTNLDDLKDFPEEIAANRRADAQKGHAWLNGRRTEQSFTDTSPTVLIIGAGHSGLMVAARLKYLGVSCLVVDRNEQIGDNWRNRYDALCLHWPIHVDHMAYIPFPPTWPKYTPGPKIADWLQFYAQALDINVWTSCEVLSASQNPDKTWAAKLKVGSGEEKVFNVSHLVFATGSGDASPNVPQIAGQKEFKGQVVHSNQYKRAADFLNKRVIVIGAGNSGHDVAADLAEGGIDVTMYQRSSTFVMNLDKNWKFLGGHLYSEGAPPIETADILFNSIPHLMQENGLAQRSTKAIEASDKVLLDGLRKVGFRLNSGIKDTGILLLLKQKGGGHYFDIGASQMIIDGKIKLKNDSQIKCFTEDGLEFEDGSKLPADVVVLATGLGSPLDPIRAICGDRVAESCKPIGGLNKEGEFQGLWRDIGVQGLWYLMGPLQLGRIHSKHMALQIKAIEEKVFTQRYEKSATVDLTSL